MLQRLCSTAALSFLTFLMVACAGGAPAISSEARGGGFSGAPAPAAPMLPLNTNFWSYWTHYWTTYLPDHPIYEMIELTAYENPHDPSDVLVRVFLTERAGQKRQYFYLNDESEVRRSRANASYRDIVYRRTGPEGGPQNLYVEFMDKDGVSIQWTVVFPEGAALRDYDAGLTPSIHSVGSVMLFALRTRTIDTYDDRVLFDGANFAYDGAASDATPGTRSWYNPDYYSAILLFGRIQFRQENGVLSNSWGRVFAPLPENPSVYRTDLLGPENFAQFELDNAGRMASYAHFSRGHSFDFAFDPPLPTLADAEDGAQFRFNVSFDGGRSLMAGDVRVHRTASDTVILEWTPCGPEWAVDRDFWSIIRQQETGYELTLTENRDLAFPEAQ